MITLYHIVGKSKIRRELPLIRDVLKKQTYLPSDIVCSQIHMISKIIRICLNNDEVVGYFFVNEDYSDEYVTLAYAIHYNQRGKGILTQSIRALLDTCSYKEIHCHVESSNLASSKGLIRVGFQKIGEEYVFKCV